MDTKYSLVEQIRSLLGGGTAPAGARYEPRMIGVHLKQAINRHLKAEYLNVTLPGDETIPEGVVLATYDGVPVEKYKGLSRARLPVMPIGLRRNMGVFFVGPAVTNTSLDTPVLVITRSYATEVALHWTLVSHGTLYILERALSSDFVDGLTQRYGGDETDFIDRALTPYTTYYYRIRVFADNFGTSDYGTAVATTTGYSILHELGDHIISEADGLILLETLAVAFAELSEAGDYILDETGNHILLEV